jgi:hypothetical protein
MKIRHIIIYLVTWALLIQFPLIYYSPVFAQIDTSEILSRLKARNLPHSKLYYSRPESNSIPSRNSITVGNVTDVVVSDYYKKQSRINNLIPLITHSDVEDDIHIKAHQLITSLFSNNYFAEILSVTGGFQAITKKGDYLDSLPDFPESIKNINSGSTVGIAYRSTYKQGTLYKQIEAPISQYISNTMLHETAHLISQIFYELNSESNFISNENFETSDFGNRLIYYYCEDKQTANCTTDAVSGKYENIEYGMGPITSRPSYGATNRAEFFAVASEVFFNSAGEYKGDNTFFGIIDSGLAHHTNRGKVRTRLELKSDSPRFYNFLSLIYNGILPINIDSSAPPNLKEIIIGENNVQYSIDGNGHVFKKDPSGNWEALTGLGTVKHLSVDKDGNIKFIDLNGALNTFQNGKITPYLSKVGSIEFSYLLPMKLS